MVRLPEESVFIMWALAPDSALSKPSSLSELKEEGVEPNCFRGVRVSQAGVSELYIST